MHPDVAKLVEAGRINGAVGEKLSKIAPGSYRIHKGYGGGVVTDWDLFGGKVTIDFEKEKGKVMGLKLALEKTEAVEPDDVRAQKVSQIDELKELAKSNPVELVAKTIASHGGYMTMDQLDAELAGSVIEAGIYKKWWKRQRRYSGKVSWFQSPPNAPTRLCYGRHPLVLEKLWLRISRWLGAQKGASKLSKPFSEKRPWWLR